MLLMCSAYSASAYGTIQFLRKQIIKLMFSNTSEMETCITREIPVAVISPSQDVNR